MTLPMARDLGKYGIRVMTLAPGVYLYKIKLGILNTNGKSFK